MKKIRNSLILLIIILLLPTVIYALFFDKEKSNNNTFSAATLDIEFKTTQSTEYTLEPKDSKWVVDINLTNLGTIKNTNAITFHLKEESWTLANNILLIIEESPDTTFPTDPNEYTPSMNMIYTGALSSLSTTGIELDVGETKLLRFTFQFNPNIEDKTSLYAKSISFKIVSLATQIAVSYPRGFYDFEKITFKISTPSPAIVPQEPTAVPSLEEEEAPIPEIQPVIEQPTQKESNITPLENINEETL